MGKGTSARSGKASQEGTRDSVRAHDEYMLALVRTSRDFGLDPLPMTWMDFVDATERRGTDWHPDAAMLLQHFGGIL